ncbi:MAG: glycosyltransferase family 2 protein [Chlamydiae bacterium]|nr:glycosyltransferase family 2 protein [Chlamydiota bacterium]MBI3277303.1 glycosyltransferase family 2 protein [Chlamydiota bacterium]
MNVMGLMNQRWFNIRLLSKILPGGAWKNFLKRCYWKLKRKWQRVWLYQYWIYKNTPDKKELKRQKELSSQYNYHPLLSIIVPVYNPKKLDLIQCIQSVLNQSYDHWELCLADGGSDQSYVRKILEKFSRQDSRIKVSFLPQNLGIAGNSNEALALVTGEYVGLLDHDDLLAPFALFEVVKLLNQDPTLDFIYSDEDKVSRSSRRRHTPHFKPDWSPDTLLSCNYITHFSVMRKRLVEDVGRFQKGFDGSQDYDLILRVTGKTSRIAHIPKILYHWRESDASVASGASNKLYAYPHAKKALESYLGRKGVEAEVLDGKALSLYRVKYHLSPGQKITIIIPTQDKVDLLKTCIDSIFRKTDYKDFEILIVDNQSVKQETYDFYERIGKEKRVRIIHYPKPFNFSAMNNFAVSHVTSEHILFLNNDTEVINNEWLSAMLEFSQRKDVGAVGAKLYYPNDTVQHAGVIIGLWRGAGHSHKYAARSSHGYMGRLSIIQNLSAVTAACMMVRKEVFEEVGGFDEKMAVAFNDVDFCLKICEKGYLIIFTPYAELYHDESTSRGRDDTREKRLRSLQEIEYLRERWKFIFEKGDPYYNPNLTLDSEGFDLKF